MKTEPIVEVRASAQHPDLPLAEMRALLAKAVVEARAEDPPGDGGMRSLGEDVNIGAGAWAGGWKLQATFVHDERMWSNGPQVIVHAYREDTLSQGWMRVPIEAEYTPEDRRARTVKRIAWWRERFP
jgi:hypothetical protein